MSENIFIMSLCPFWSVQMLRILGNGEKMRNVHNIPIISIRQSSEDSGIPHSHVIWPFTSRAYMDDGEREVIDVKN